MLYYILVTIDITHIRAVEIWVSWFLFLFVTACLTFSHVTATSKMKDGPDWLLV